jgi:hypothetical protein
LDVDNLAPGPDLDAIDFAKLDLGNTLPGEEPPAPAAEEPKVETPPAEEPPEPEEKPAAEEPPPRDEKGKFTKKDGDHIPKARFNEAVGKERDAREQAERRAEELEARLRQQEQAQQQQVQRSEQIAALDTQLDTLEAQRDALLLDGDKEKAAALNKQIRELNRVVARMEANEESGLLINATLERERMTATIARFEAERPDLNPKSQEFNKPLVEAILMSQQSLVDNGMAPSAALVAAVRKMDELVAAAKGSVTPPASEEGLGKANVAEDRTKAAVEKALATQKAQPANSQTTGMDSDKAGLSALPDVSKMSFEEFNALPESTRARLRGDML